ncbi:uncharacterized protein METZ01_LOCUS409282, partial [marine metagenome]
KLSGHSAILSLTANRRKRLNKRHARLVLFL